jgi:hypothetical protein
LTSHWYLSVTASLSASVGGEGWAKIVLPLVGTPGDRVTPDTTGFEFTVVVAAAGPGTVAVPSVADTEQANTSPSAVSEAATTDDVPCTVAPLKGWPFFVQVNA